MRLHRHHKPVSHEVAVERAHSADLARQLAEAHERLDEAQVTIRKQARAIDDLKYERRELAGQVANLRAQLAATVRVPNSSPPRASETRGGGGAAATAQIEGNR